MTDRSSPAPTPRTEAGRLPAEHPDRCQTWGYFSGLRCWYRQGHRGTHRLEPLTEPLTHQFGVGKRAEGEASAPLEPPRPLYNASGTTANADLPRADSATALPLDVDAIVAELINERGYITMSGDHFRDWLEGYLERLGTASERPNE